MSQQKFSDAAEYTHSGLLHFLLNKDVKQNLEAIIWALFDLHHVNMCSCADKNINIVSTSYKHI